MKLSAMIRGVIVLMIAVAIGGGAAYAGFGIGMTGAVKNKIKKVDDKVTEKIEEEEERNRTTYSVADINGPWMIAFGSGENAFHVYVVANGAGTITDLGSNNMWSTPGTYSVSSAGVLAVTILDSGTGAPKDQISGTMTSKTTASIRASSVGSTSYHEGTMAKIDNPGAMAGSWTGTVQRTSPVETMGNFSFTVGASGTGSIVDVFPLPATITLFAQGNLVSGKIVSTTTGAWSTVVLTGTVTGNMSGGVGELDAAANDKVTFLFQKN